MHIEDWIDKIGGDYIAGQTLATHERSFFYDLSGKVAVYGQALTEKQGNAVLRILEKHKEALEKCYPGFKLDLANPTWAKPFRTISQSRRIFIEKKIICLEFPYDENVMKIMKGWIEQKSQNEGRWRRGMWEHELRRWEFALTEDCVLFVGDEILTQPGFEADEQFLTLYREVCAIRDSVESHFPTLIKKDGVYTLANVSNKVPHLETKNLREALFKARARGITIWDDKIDAEINAGGFSLVSKAILSLTGSNAAIRKKLWVDVSRFEIGHFSDVITYGGPTLIILAGGSESEQIVQWTNFLLGQEIKKEEISVMFRVPNPESTFNTFVRENGLNGPVSEKTKVVFVNTKVPKPVVKSGIKFATMINLGFHLNLHHTITDLSNSCQNSICYSLKAPSSRFQEYKAV